MDDRQNVAYIGLGSNLNSPVDQLQLAKDALAAIPHTKIVAFSGLYSSPPMGPADQPDYINAVVALSTQLTPLALLHSLQAIEQQLGRVRNGERWGPRTIDLDLLLFDQLSIKLPELTIPHPGLTERAFVLYPLHEIASEQIVPGYTTVAGLAARCPQQGLVKLDRGLS